MILEQPWSSTLHQLCGANVSSGLHGTAHAFQRESAATAIVADTQLSQIEPGVTPDQFKAALLVGAATVYRENPSGSLKHIDGVPVPGPTRITAATMIPANTTVDFFNCGKPNIVGP